MNGKLLFIIAAFTSLVFSQSISYGQVINLGTAANFVLFTTNGAITNTGITHLTGHVGSNVGGSTGFGNVDGVMHDQDPASAAATVDLNSAYLQLNAAVAAFFPGISLGAGQTLNAGVYNIPAAATMNGTLNLDAQGDPNAVFIIQIDGTFGIGTNAQVVLLNGAQACKVYWKVEGQVSIASGVTMKGTIVANNAAIAMSAGDSLEGRALSINGAIGVNAITAYMPLGCLAPILTGPGNPIMGTTECFVLFSGIGPVTNVGVTTVTGDIGSNNGLTTGYNPLLVTGNIHPVPDGATAQCGADFTNIYNNLNALPYDIELLYPAQFGNNLVLTPHVYLMNGAVTFTDSLYLNAQGNADAVFVFQVNGAFGTSTFSRVILQNGAQAKNVYWVINGAVSISDYSIFNGTIISQGAIDLLTGVTLYGRALTGVGAISTFAIDAIMPTSCSPVTITQPSDTLVCAGQSASFTIIAGGQGLTYQWRKGTVDLVNGGNISGATTATLIINPASIADTSNVYNVVISGTYVPNDTSIYVSLTIDTAPVITDEPINVTVCAGDSVGFTVASTGTGLSYQWRKGTVDLVNGGSISGANTDTLIINPANIGDTASNYNVVITGTCLPNDTSIFVSLLIDTAPVITDEPINVTVCAGDSVGFTVASTGTGLTYQWRKGTVNLVNGGSISGATTDTLIINPANIGDTANNYNVVITGTCLPNDTSIFVSLTIDVAPVITTEPIDATVCAGDSVGFTVISTGIGISYQWRKGIVNLVDNLTVSGSTTASLSINPATIGDASNEYNVVITGTCSPNATSIDVVLIVDSCLTDVSVTKTASSMTPAVGQTIIFTIVAANLSTLNATGVTVVDILQSGYSYVSSTTSAGSFNSSTGVWTIGNLNAGNSATLTITADVFISGSYENTATISSAEPETDSTNNVSTILPVPTDFFIPEGFSPNGDLVNDLFIIRGILNFPSNDFSVYNRWGDLVFSASPYKNTWDGTSTSDYNVGGDVLPVGTYFYVLDLKDSSDVFKGTIYLNN